MESPSLELFKRCLYLVMSYGLVVLGLQQWHWVGLDDLKGLFQPRHFYNFMKCFWIFSLVLVVILRPAKIKVHICGVNIGISTCAWIYKTILFLTMCLICKTHVSIWWMAECTTHFVYMLYDHCKLNYYINEFVSNNSS